MYRQKRQVVCKLYTTWWTLCKGLKSKVLALPKKLYCIDRYDFPSPVPSSFHFNRLTETPRDLSQSKKGFEWLNSLGIELISAWQNKNDCNCNGNRCQNFIGFFSKKSTWKKCAYLSFNKSLRPITRFLFYLAALGVPAWDKLWYSPERIYRWKSNL